MVPGDNTQVVPLEGAMCVADEPKVLCIIRDTTNTDWTSGKITLNLPASVTARQLVQEVAQRFQYEIGSFELVLQAVPDNQVIVSDLHDEMLSDIGFRSGQNMRNSLIIGEKNGECPRRAQGDDSVTLQNLSQGEVASASWGGDGDKQDGVATDAPDAKPQYEWLLDDVKLSKWGSSGKTENSYIKQDAGYVGLVNQAMTCYLNSLLQTLYMTPEFRNALYRWDFDGKDDGVKSIPFQLQKLFLQLQMCRRHAVETTELTRSFGWDSSEAWQQHDVQELCRVMFDALEQKFRNTDQADLINHLYQGKLKDYVKCLECSYESAREDSYLDIPLPVRPFGQTQAYGSVEEALRGFVQPEVLDNSNQYSCERCNKKCDAHKGLKFLDFPYLLTIQLKRFDFDYNTMHRIKLNDKVTFPEILNLNSFIKSDHDELNDDASTTDSGSALDDDLPPLPTSSILSPSLAPAANNATASSLDPQDDDEGIDLGCSSMPVHNNHEVSTNEKNLRHSMEKGPYQYELFSIMVHSGSANGGHYYAYIKSFKDGQWYCFNDQTVTRITYDDIRKTYGGGPPRGYFSGAYSSSTNAYMLMYRQIDKEKNADSMTAEEFPEHIKQLVVTMQEHEERERQQKEEERNMCRIKLFCQHPVHNRMLEKRLRVHKDTTLAEAIATAYEIMDLEDIVPLEQCRLVKYDDVHDSLECSFENSDDVPMGELLGGSKSFYKFDLLLEIRPAERQFQVYRPGGTTVKVFHVNLEMEDVEEPVTVRACLTDTVEEFEKQVAEVLGVSTTYTHMRVVLVKYSNDLRVLSNPAKTLKAEGFYRGNRVFVECSDPEDAQRPFEQSRLSQVLDCFEHTVSLSVMLPGTSKDILERLGIPALADGPQGEPSGSQSKRNGLQQDGGPGTSGAGGSGDASHPKQNIAATPPSSRNATSHFGVDVSIDPCDPVTGGGGGYPDTAVPKVGSSNAYHSDQSEDSSLTDSERTLVGDESPVPPQVETIRRPSNSSISPQESGEDEQNLSSPDDPPLCYKKSTSEDWDEGSETEEQDVHYYFKAMPCHELDNRVVRVLVDKRITLGAFKKELEPYVGVAVDFFKVYRLYGNNQEFECSRLNENLAAFPDETKVVVRLGRVLKKGEYNVKFYQLLLNEPETAKFLMEWVLCQGMTVLEARRSILPELAAKCSLEIPLNRCRLRKKSWRTPSAILLDNQRFEDEIPMFANWEAFVEVLPGEEPLIYPSQLALFVRRWRPSTFSLDPFQEIILDNYTVEELRQKLSDASDVPAENIDFAKGQGSFPCEVSLLSIDKELEWNPKVKALNCNPLYICDDGHVMYYRDNREQGKQLTEDERREITNKEHAKLNKVGHGGYSPRKERALKIYTDNPPVTPPSAPAVPAAMTTTTTLDPDLD